MVERSERWSWGRGEGGEGQEWRRRAVQRYSEVTNWSSEPAGGPHSHTAIPHSQSRCHSNILILFNLLFILILRSFSTYSHIIIIITMPCYARGKHEQRHTCKKTFVEATHANIYIQTFPEFFCILHTIPESISELRVKYSCKFSHCLLLLSPLVTGGDPCHD